MSVDSVAPAAPAVLVVGDDLGLRELLCRALGRRGFSAAGAGSIRDALVYLDREPFDVLVCDLRLPDGSGSDLLRWQRRRPGPCAIALSGVTDDQTQRAARAAGFVEFLAKPVMTAALLAAIVTHCRPSPVPTPA